MQKLLASLAVVLGFTLPAFAVPIPLGTFAIGGSVNIGEVSPGTGIIEYSFSISGPIEVSIASGIENGNGNLDFNSVGLSSPNGGTFFTNFATTSNPIGLSSFSGSWKLFSGAPAEYVLSIDRSLIVAGAAWGGSITFTACQDCAPPPGVPLPAALPLLAAAIGGGGLLNWRRRKRKI